MLSDEKLDNIIEMISAVMKAQHGDRTDRFYRRPAMPSREFFIRQALLNVADAEDTVGMIEGSGIPAFLLACTTASGYVRGTLCEKVRAEFKRLVATYEH